MNKNDEVICTVKGYVNHQSHHSTLLLIHRDADWLLVNKQLEQNRPVVVSILDASFYHTFTCVTEHQRQQLWRLEWNGADQRRCVFQTREAVEARSLDRGFRIIQGELNQRNNSLQSIPSSIGDAATTTTQIYANEYSLEPHLMHAQSSNTTVSSTQTLPKHRSKKKSHHREHCHHCGRKYFSSRKKMELNRDVPLNSTQSPAVLRYATTPRRNSWTSPRPLTVCDPSIDISTSSFGTSYKHRASMRRQKSQLDIDYTERMERIIDIEGLEAQKRARHQRQRHDEVEEVLGACKTTSDEFERAFEDLISKAERTMSLWTPEKKVGSTQTPTTQRKNERLERAVQSVRSAKPRRLTFDTVSSPNATANRVSKKPIKPPKPQALR